MYLHPEYFVILVGRDKYKQGNHGKGCLHLHERRFWEPGGGFSFSFRFQLTY
jgi:hypothetical protein